MYNLHQPSFGLANCCDLFEKLKYEFQKLTPENTDPYTLFNYLTTSNHLNEWIKGDCGIDQGIKDEAEEYRKNSNEHRIINSLCNSAKHFKLKNKDKEVDKKVLPGLDFNHLDFNNLNFGGTVYYVTVDREDINIYDICKMNFEFWNTFFQNHKITFRG